MMLTEDEAKTKWCPFARYLAVFTNDAGRRETAGCYNRGYEDSGLKRSNCITSQCMAWRWHWHGNQHGYCGLAPNPISYVKEVGDL